MTRTQKPWRTAFWPPIRLIGACFIYLLAALVRPFFLALCIFDPISRESWDNMSNDMAGILESAGLITPKGSR